MYIDNTKLKYMTKIKHGHSFKKLSPTYKTWLGMKQRCLNSNHTAYKYYGAKGKSVCDRWLKFENFLEDMGERPKEKTLDRIDSRLGYFKENCRWATFVEQQANRFKYHIYKQKKQKKLRPKIDDILIPKNLTALEKMKFLRQQGLTYKSIGEYFSCSTQRIHQILN